MEDEKMVTTVTLSPCLDKTVKTSRLDLDGMNRVEGVSLDIGGKGINVSRALSRLGIENRAVGFNFSGGEKIEETLLSEGIQCGFTQCSGSLRTNLKLMETELGRTVEINESNPAVSDENIQELKRVLSESARDSEILVLAGSVPKGVGNGIYRELSEIARSENPDIRIVLDAQGELLLNGLEARPFMIKPNIFELETAVGRKLSGESEIISTAREIISKYGVQIVMVSMGGGGAVIVSANECHKLPAVKVEVRSTQGAGDSMVAGAIAAITEGLSLENILKYAVTAAAGAISQDGTTFCTKQLFTALLHS